MENQRLNFKMKERLIDRIFVTSRLLLKVKKNQCLTHFGNIIISSSYIHRKNGKSHIGQISLSTILLPNSSCLSHGVSKIPSLS